ncbi:MAG: hypothetical protein ABR610_08335 [Thermoanaerobaculia bacterium]
MAMGATPRETLRLVAVEACVSPAPGSCSGLSERSRPRALCGTPLRGRSQDPATFAGAAAVLLLVSPVTTLLPACRAASTDLMIALRFDG